MTSGANSRSRLFWVWSLVVTLVVAGGLSYLASGSPDGLDSATLRGCQFVENAGTEVLTGQCIAQSAQENAMAGSPLADYSVRGADGSVGVAGVIGVLVTLALAAGLFWVIARAKPGKAKSVADGG